MAADPGIFSSIKKTLGISNEPEIQDFEKKWKQHNNSEKIPASIKTVRVAQPAQQFCDPVNTTRNKEKNTNNISSVPDPRIEKFQSLLNSPSVSMEDLRKLCWNGVPADVRSCCWGILMGYIPPVKERQDKTISSKRKKYWDCVSQLYKSDSERSEYEQQLYHQISIDVPRTNPNVPLFQIKKVQEILLRILYIWAVRHPATGYVQGINDLVTPFFAVFLQKHISHQKFGTIDVTLIEDVKEVDETDIANVEADSYWCLTKFIDGIQDHYTFAQPGIQKMLYKLKEIVLKIDAPLHDHLIKENIEYIQIAFRWMNCLLMREIPLKVLIRMWDTYLSEGESFATLHVYVCAAFLVKWSTDIKTKDFPALMTFIQNLPTKNWSSQEIETLLSQAYIWKTLYNDSTGHLKSNKVQPTT